MDAYMFQKFDNASMVFRTNNKKSFEFRPQVKDFTSAIGKSLQKCDIKGAERDFGYLKAYEEKILKAATPETRAEVRKYLEEGNLLLLEGMIQHVGRNCSCFVPGSKPAVSY
jgi:phosphoribulokinase